MANETLFTHRQRGGTNDGQYVLPVTNERGEALISDGLPRHTEYTRLGARWKVATATAFAAVVALPTTTAPLEIKNNKLGYVMVVDTIWSWQLLGTAVVWGHTPWAQVGAAVVSANTALVEYSANGGDAVTSALTADAVCAINQTVVANGWETFPGATMNFGLAAATPGGVCIGEVAGRLVVPYGKSLHVAVSASITTASAFQCGASWFWAPITNVT